MIILSQSYVTLKKKTGAEFARKALLESVRRNKGTLLKEICEYLLKLRFIPRYQWTVIMRKGHPENNPFVERSHQTDDFEFYIPHFLRAKSELDFIKLGARWQKVYNLVRPHMELKDVTPYEKLRSLNSTVSQEFCLFPTLILYHLVNLPFNHTFWHRN